MFLRLVHRCQDGFKVVGSQCVDVDECRDECSSLTQADFQILYQGLAKSKAGRWPCDRAKNRPLQILTRLVRSFNLKEIDLKIFICVLVMYVMNVL